MDTTVRVAESEAEVSYGHSSTDGIERGGRQLWTQQSGWQRVRRKSVMDTTVRMPESEVEASYGHNRTDGIERGGSQLWTQQSGW
ncbi:hypothetical protein LSAT2_027228, partial [Lamellibrachia satsuma]